MGAPAAAQSGLADQEHRARLNQHLRQAFIEGAEEDSRRRLERGLTAEELRVLGRYPGDLPERREREAPTVARSRDRRRVVEGRRDGAPEQSPAAW